MVDDQLAKVPELLAKLTALRDDMLRLERHHGPGTVAAAGANVVSAGNLLHYLALRRHDLRGLQEELAALGLSSLGRAEGAVLATVDAVLGVLSRLTDAPAVTAQAVGTRTDFVRGRRLLAEHTAALLGPAPEGRAVRIMVTMPAEAATDYGLVRDLLTGGMDCMRINCAHDGPPGWLAMIDHLRRACLEVGRPCRVLMDLAGPKLRTGALEPGPRVLKVKPRRDCCGRVTAPARVWLTPAEEPAAPPAPASATVPGPGSWLAQLAGGDHVTFRDARGSSRDWLITEAAGAGRWAEATQTAYVATGTALHASRPGRHPADPGVAVGELPALALPLVLHRGDVLVLTRDPSPGRPAVRDPHGRTDAPARIPCTLPEVFADLRPGHTVWLDDGKIGGIARLVTADAAHVEITQAPASGAKLGADKGINLPDTELRLPALTADDLRNLDFVAAHADLVGLSFVHHAADVAQLHMELARRANRELGVVLKIETRQGFDELPQLLLAALRGPCAGVMIARGDLAVECGFQRLAELQEEILWLCEAAHVPVIWATQVLEHLAKEGAPSRAEITDAAMGERAECVMLNKGPHVVAAVRALDDILRRMEGHQHKKRPMLRRLKLADRFPAAATV
jgi:pyruvate kinase